MRKLLTLILCVAMAAPGWAQYRRLKLDSLGLPPMPGASNVGHISLPLASILKPEPGQKMTGPALTDLAINSYRTPLTMSVDRIAAFYLKYAGEAHWRLLDDIPDSATNRTLVFWSPEAPGYLTVEIGPGPNNTRQIDLTRLLGDVNPSRPGEVLRLTGKRVREQRVDITYAGRFLDLKTNKLVRLTEKAVEDRSEAGLPITAAKWLAPMEETYAVAIRVTDSTKSLTSAEAYAANGVKVAHAESAKPTGALTMLGKIRAAQGPVLRVVIMGRPQQPPPEKPKPSPAKPVAKPLVKPGAKPAGKQPSKEPAFTQPGKAPAKAAAPKPAGNAAAGAAAAPAAPPVPETPPIVLTEWYGMRPPLTALPEARRLGVTTRAETITLVQDEELGSTCDGPLFRSFDYVTETTDSFPFSPDLFGSTLVRAPVGSRKSTMRVDFPARSGESNQYTAIQTKTITTTDVVIGYSYQGQWIALPGKKVNPTKAQYESSVVSVPVVTRKSTGTCAPKPQAMKAGATQLAPPAPQPEAPAAPGQ